MTQKYQLTFSGIILPGFDHDQTKEYTQKLLKLSSDQIEGFFSGKTVVIKKNLPLDEAQKIKSALESKGLLVNLAEDKSDFSVAAENTAPVVGLNDANNVGKTNESFSYYASPAAALSSRRDDEEGAIPSFFALSFEGRLGRLSYLNMFWSIYGVFLLVVLVLGIVLAVLGVGANLISGSFNSFSVGLVILYFVAMLFPMFYWIRAMALRLHDLNRSAWHCLWMLLVIIPLLGALLTFAFGIYLLCAKGTEGSNNHGPQPKQGSIVGLVLTCIGFGIWIIAIVAVIATGAYGSL